MWGLASCAYVVNVCCKFGATEHIRVGFYVLLWYLFRFPAPEHIRVGCMKYGICDFDFDTQPLSIFGWVVWMFMPFLSALFFCCSPQVGIYMFVCIIYFDTLICPSPRVCSGGVSVKLCIFDKYGYASSKNGTNIRICSIFLNSRLQAASLKTF